MYVFGPVNLILRIKLNQGLLCASQKQDHSSFTGVSATLTMQGWLFNQQAPMSKFTYLELGRSSPQLFWCRAFGFR